MAKPSATSGKGKEQIKKEDVKQAVIVDYKALGTKCPGGSTNTKPFIQYSLEWLLIEQFDEIFVCCLPENVQQIRAFVKNFIRTENVPSSMTIHVHSSENNMSTGDCLRDLDSKALIKSDFVIMDVGCCGNLPLAELLDAHKALKKIDKDVIMTSICRNVFSKNPAEIGEFPIYITDPTSGHLLHYVAGRISETGQGSRMESCQKESVEVPSKIFLERDSVKIYTNLCSTNLSVYSANVPARFTELFDHHSEADLIQAAFDNEYLGGTVYVQVIDDLFSQRMADFGFAINQKWDQFDTNLIYKRNHRYQVLRKLVNDSLIGCTRLNTEDYLSSLKSDDEESVVSDTDSEVSVIEDDVIFLREVLESLVRGFEETIENENLKLEVNSSKHAYNISISDVVATIARALLILPEKLTNRPKSVLEYSNLVDISIMKFRQFLLNYIKNSESRQTATATMEEIYHSNQIEFLNDTVLAKVFYKLYEIDALDEDSLLGWFRSFDESDDLQRDLRAKPALKQLILALEAESEEEEEGDETDGDDDDDDDE